MRNNFEKGPPANDDFFKNLADQYKKYGVYLDPDDPEHIKIKTKKDNFIAIAKRKKIPMAEEEINIEEIILRELKKLKRLE